MMVRWYKPRFDNALLIVAGLDVHSKNCSFTKGMDYCGKYYFGESTAPSAVTDSSSSLPIRVSVAILLAELCLT